MSLKKSILNNSNSFKYYKDEYSKLNDSLKKSKTEIYFLKNKVNDQNVHISILIKCIEEAKSYVSMLNNMNKNDNAHISKLNNKIKDNIALISEIDIKAKENAFLVSILDKRLNRICSNQNIAKSRHDVNIAYVLRAFPIHSETFIVNEIRWLKQNQYNVFVFCSGKSPKLVDLDFEIVIINFKNLLDLEKLLVDNEIDFVHTHFVYPTATKFTFPACERLKIPFTIFAHAYDIFVKENARRNKISEISNSQFCRGIFTLSNFHKDYLINENVNEEKIIITKQATDYTLSNLVPKKNNIKKIISVSRFVEKKGIDTFISAAKLLEGDDFEFSIYGYGDLESELQAQIDDLNCSNIAIKGELHPTDVEKLLKGSDLLVSPCKMAKNGDLDGFPTVIFEAMAAGLPVLTTNISAIPEIIKDSYNGFIIDPDNPQMLANKILEISNFSNDELYKIRKQAQNDVIDISSTEKTMTKFVNLIMNDFKI